MYGQSDLTRNTSRQVEEGFVASGAASKSSKNTLASDLLQYPSAEVAAWTSQTVVDQASFEVSTWWTRKSVWVDHYEVLNVALLRSVLCFESLFFLK